MRHRCPAEIISPCVWLYCRFCLSDRDVEELMAERGISLTYEEEQTIDPHHGVKDRPQAAQLSTPK